ncbi:glycosyltransferase family 39 protein [Paenibacillus segetis]|uniref:Mannosyltransferase YkcB n=1 Tax=Paenibacillus segetis TaxID=1325360 RepID=A0ABQ1YUD6_9BACL|nr:glycosyltransferase family 39 protein [Paenibacillus segetis]GGH39204.1 putative mannosyltransferase YkcB [Paenibacillus segetis]
MGFVKKHRVDIPIVLTLLLAAFLNGFGIWRDHYVNTYYTTAVGSMLQSFHNFFYASLDSAGSVTVDKPPVTFWIQSIFAYVFGLYGWSVILPQALTGVGSVWLIYLLIKPTFGLTAARLSALVLACTPIVASVSRTNNIDSMLVFDLLLGTWFLFRGVRGNKTWSILGAFAVIGVGFNMKMLEAYMVVPAFYLFYLLAVKLNWKKKLSILAGATVMLIVVSLSWAVIVDSIPENERPYIGSSQTNSVLELAFGYNGIARLTGNKGGGVIRSVSHSVEATVPSVDDKMDKVEGSDAADSRTRQFIGKEDAPLNETTLRGGTQRTESPFPGIMQGNGFIGGGANPKGFSNGGGNIFGTGEKGVFRLFQSGLSGQTSWLIPFAAWACIALFSGLRRNNFTPRHKEGLFWLAWLIPGMAFFSVAGFFHQYYLIMLAPPVAALVGAGWTSLWESFSGKSGWTSWLLPTAIVTTALLEWYIIQPYDDTIGAYWSMGILIAGVLAAGLLIVVRGKGRNITYWSALIGLLVLLIGPLFWSATPIVYGQNSQLPQAGPSRSAGHDGMGLVGGKDFSIGKGIGNGIGMGNVFGGGGMPGGNSSQGVNSDLLSYLKENNTGETYLFAAANYGTAAPYIIDKGEHVIILGGYSGSDPVYTTDKLAHLVASGQVKFFMISQGGRGGSSEITDWIKEHGKEIQVSNSTLYEVTLGN